MWIASIARFSAFFGGGSDDEEGGLGFIGVIVLSMLAPVAAMVVQMAVSPVQGISGRCHICQHHG